MLVMLRLIKKLLRYVWVSQMRTKLLVFFFTLVELFFFFAVFVNCLCRLRADGTAGARRTIVGVWTILRFRALIYKQIFRMMSVRKNIWD